MGNSSEYSTVIYGRLWSIEESWWDFWGGDKAITRSLLDDDKQSTELGWEWRLINIKGSSRWQVGCSPGKPTKGLQLATSRVWPPNKYGIWISTTWSPGQRNIVVTNMWILLPTMTIFVRLNCHEAVIFSLYEEWHLSVICHIGIENGHHTINFVDLCAGSMADL